MRVHELKCWPQYFREVRSGDKTFEWRFNGDRDFKKGDAIYQREYDIRTGKYSGEETIHGAGYILVVGDHSAISLLPPTSKQISLCLRASRRRGKK